MSFASPAWLLFGFLASLVVVALHGRKRATVVVASLHLWQRLVGHRQEPRSWRLPRVSTSLILQLAAVALLSIGLARPLVQPDARWDHWIIVLDASGSMTATDVESSRMEAARAALVQGLRGRTIDRTREQIVSVVVADARPRVLKGRATSVRDVEGALQNVRAGHAAVDWPRLADAVEAVVLDGERVRITVATDEVDDATVLDPLRRALPNARVERVSVGARTENVALTSLEVKRNAASDGDWNVRGTVERHVDEAGALDVTLSFQPEGEEGLLEWASIELDAMETDFEAEISLPGPGLLEARISDDPLAFDNARWAVLRAGPRTARVLLVGRPNPAIIRALEAMNHVELSRADTLPESLDDVDLVVVSDGMIDRTPNAATLWLASGPGRNEGVTLSAPNPTGWSLEHELARSVGWAGVAVDEAWDVSRLAGADVLLEAAGSPLIQARMGRYGPEVAVSFRLERSTWPETPGFAVFIRNLVRLAVPDHGALQASPCFVGRSCRLNPRWFGQAATLVGPDGNPTFPHVRGRIADPEWEAGKRWVPWGFIDWFRPDLVGIHAVERQSGDELVPVHPSDPGESDLWSAGATTADAVDVVAPSVLPVPLWVWPLRLALVLLIIEAVHAGRGSERFLRPSGLASSNPLARRKRALLAMRALTLALIALAVWDVPGVLPKAGAHAVVVTENPAVYASAQADRVEQFLANALRSVSRIQRMAQMEMGARSRLVHGFRGEASLEDGSRPASAGVDLEGAVSLALGLLPEEGARRIVIAGADMETAGNVAELLPRLGANGVPIDVLPVGSVPEGEVLIERVTVPPNLHPGDRFALRATVFAERATTATVRIEEDEGLIAEETVDLLQGRNHTEVLVAEEREGFYEYEVRVASESDVFLENNQGGAVARIQEPAHVALVAREPSRASLLADALVAQGLDPVVMTPGALPMRQEGWLEFDVIALMDVPAIELRSTQQDQLERWVRDYGGGLLVLGGPASFGPGGYYQTPLERVSPLSSRIPEEKSDVALLFVLDRSGSMQQLVGDATRLAIAKQATLEAARLLSEESRIGVVAFDSQPTVVVPLASQQGSEALATSLAPLEPGGGTSLYPALVEALGQMRAVEATTKHVIILSDGLSQPGDFEELAEEMRDLGVTMSAVAIGRGSHRMRMQNLARWGGGSFHMTDDFRALPSILAQEALVLASSPIRETTFEPIWAERSASFVRGVATALPPIHGYVRTTAKPRADVHLEGPEQDPILASWRLGLGRVIAFTSEAVGPWLSEWPASPSYPLLWSQAVRWLDPILSGPGLHASVERLGDELLVSAEAVDSLGQPHTGLDLVADIRLPAGDERQIGPLMERSPGVYDGRVIARDAGVHEVSVHERDVAAGGESSNVSSTVRTYVDYPARFRFDRSGDGVLAGLARATGGRVLLGDEQVFGPSEASWRWTSSSVWAVWALLGLGVLLVELMVRYGWLLARIASWRRARAQRWLAGDVKAS